MSLQKEIRERARQIRTDSYPMSVGELLNLYRDGEIDVHPEFQRIYRWTDTQKTKLIESLLLGIPLPPIFVAQRSDGVWDVVDGVQRLSTILQFTGNLKDELDNLVPPLVLQRTAYLPSLEGKQWHNPKDKDASFTRDQQLYIKRARMDINIVLKESDDEAKYELFMRLNTGGSPLSPQEVRNCLMVMAYKEAYEWLRTLSDDESFLSAIALSDRNIEEQYNMELATRFLLFRRMSEDRLKEVADIGEFLNTHLHIIADFNDNDRVVEQNAFKSTFATLSDALGDDAFHRYDTRKGRFMGGFSISAFEAVALGVGYHYTQKAGIPHIADMKVKIQNLWENPTFVQYSGSGVRASSRLPQIVPLGRKLFQP